MANPNTITPFAFFQAPEEALAPLSAGTFTSYICNDCNGEATPVLNTPHPAYTNEAGKTVIQTQMVALGGLNGLNN